MSKKLIIQVKENYTRDVFIEIEIDDEKISELDELMDEFEGESEDYESLLDELESKGIKIKYCDDNDSLFDFEENNFVDYRELDEREG